MRLLYSLRLAMAFRWLLMLLLAFPACSRDETPPLPIALVPIGPVTPELLAHLQRELPASVKREVILAAGIPLPAAALDPKRGQYLGDALLADLAKHDVKGTDRVVGIIDADAYAPGLNFIFGQARLPGRFAVVALPRLRDSFRGRPHDETRFRERATKEAVHEIGHSFGFTHCDKSTCVMHFSNSFVDTDRKTAHFCNREVIP